jgi:hypothetical protein
MAATSLEAVRTKWFDDITKCMRATGIETVLDFGFHSQAAHLSRRMRHQYRFVTNGLTASEERCLDRTIQSESTRQIPWAFIGHQTPNRAALIDYLVSTFDPRGVVYIPNLSPCREKGSPHLNQEQFEAVLRHTKYQLWCSHHTNQTYLESERFRMSVLTGSVPVKITMGDANLDECLPFRYLMTDVHSLVTTLRSWNFGEIRERFCTEFKNLERLHDGLERFLTEVWPGDATEPKPSQAQYFSNDLSVGRGEQANEPSVSIGVGLVGEDLSS